MGVTQCGKAQLLLNGKPIGEVRESSFVYETVAAEIPEAAWGIYGSPESLRTGMIMWFIATKEQIRESDWRMFRLDLDQRLSHLLRR